MLLALFPLSRAGAQSISEAPAAMFLEVRTDARTTAMGGMASLTQAGPFAIFDNPSATLLSDNNIMAGASLSARSSFSEGNLYSAALFYRAGTRSGFGLGARSYGYDEIALTDEHGTLLSSFRPKEMALDLSYGHMLTDHLALSLTVRYIYSDLGTGPSLQKGNAFAGDLGLTWHSSLLLMDGASWSMGLTASNFGTRIRYSETGYSLPSVLRAGAAIHLPFSENHRLTGTATLGYRVLPASFSAFEAGAGAEYNLFRYGFLRAGLHVSDSEKGMGTFPTLGAGITWSGIRVDLAWWAGVPEQEYRNTLFVSLSAQF